LGGSENGLSQLVGGAAQAEPGVEKRVVKDFGNVSSGLSSLLLSWIVQPSIRAWFCRRMMLDAHRSKRNERAQSTSGFFIQGSLRARAVPKSLELVGASVAHGERVLLC
jgi:hypothetical protein